MVRRRCTRCGETKDAAADFYRRARNADGVASMCKVCAKAASAAWRAAHPDHKAQRRKADPDVWRRAHFRNRYGMSLDDVDEMIAAQGGRCGVCERDLGGRRAVDHDHSTGAVRAILCIPCNAQLPGLENLAWREKAEAYLVHHRANPRALPMPRPDLIRSRGRRG